MQGESCTGDGCGAGGASGALVIGGSCEGMKKAAPVGGERFGGGSENYDLIGIIFCENLASFINSALGFVFRQAPLCGFINAAIVDI